MDFDTQELIVIIALACFGLALAWAQDYGLFAAVFAAEAAFGFLGAAYRLWG